jgi:hypothetical protein
MGPPRNKLTTTTTTQYNENEAAGQPEEVGNSEVNAKCLAVVEQYRANQISKGDMILDITQTIPTDETESRSLPDRLSNPSSQINAR